ncbi:MAG: selenium metabolism-associated LysR family transcriptional regulator [Desulfurivibrionaceae bacterium]
MDIHQFRIFASVYRNKSFSKSSRELNISQPTISEHIKNLEKELDCSLFDRLGRSIMPTREAEIIYPRAIRLEEDLDKIKEALALGTRRIKGSLTIAASTIPGNYILPVLAARFKSRYPEVYFEIQIADSYKVANDIANHEILLGVVGASMGKRSVEYTPFLEDELVLAGTERFLGERPEWGADLYSLPFLLREAGSGTRRSMETWLTRMELVPARLNTVAVLGSTDAVKQGLKAGLGVSIVSRRAIQEELDSGALVSRALDGEPMTRSFYLVSHKRRSLPPQYLAFCDFLKEEGGIDSHQHQ